MPLVDLVPFSENNRRAIGAHRQVGGAGLSTHVGIGNPVGSTIIVRITDLAVFSASSGGTLIAFYETALATYTTSATRFQDSPGAIATAVMIFQNALPRGLGFELGLLNPGIQNEEYRRANLRIELAAGEGLVFRPNSAAAVNITLSLDVQFEER